MPSHQQNALGSRQRRRRTNVCRMNSFLSLFLLVCFLPAPSVLGFQLQMAAYKPPVKSSVSKIRSSRWRNANGRHHPQSPTDAAAQDAHILRQPSKQRASAAASIPSSPQSPSSSPPSFQDRMRGLLTKENQKAKMDRQRRQSLPPNVLQVESLQEYKAVVGDESSQLVVVRFFAPWCRACKAIQPIFYHMAKQFPNVLFVDVPCTQANANLHHGLGVPSLPYCHIYHPNGGLVEESKMSRKVISSLARKLQSYVQGRCDLASMGDASCPYPSAILERGGGPP